MSACQKIHTWYSAVTGATLAAKMSVVMKPEKPKKINQGASQLEQWSALVETLEKYGSAYSLSCPFLRVAAQGVIVHFAGDWFDDLQRDCFNNNSPDALTMGRRIKRRAKREDWARKKHLHMHARDSGSMDVGRGV